MASICAFIALRQFGKCRASPQNGAKGISDFFGVRCHPDLSPPAKVFRGNQVHNSHPILADFRKIAFVGPSLSTSGNMRQTSEDLV